MKAGNVCGLNGASLCGTDKEEQLKVTDPNKTLHLR